MTPSNARPWRLAGVILAIFPLVLLAASPVTRDEEAPSMKKLSPLITVDRIEPCLSFWTERLGFETIATVPHEDALGFAILARGGVEIMYQSRASLEADIPQVADELSGQRAALFIEVEGALDPVVEALEGSEVVVPRRQTFYGMDEIFVRAPCGTVVGFAASVEEG